MSENNIPENHDYKKITPFRLFVKSNFPFIESTYEALDNYGLYCKVVEYLNQVIEEQNLVSADMTTFTDFITSYFENLDVQEEINNKIDEMVINGTFQETLSRYFADLENQYEENYTEMYQNFDTQIDDLTDRVNGVASGSPAGVYATVNDLINANPNHSRIYVVNSDGKWYYWNSTASTWSAGGVYQSSIDLETVDDLEEKLNYITPTLSGELSDIRYSSLYPNTTQTQGAKKYVFTAGTYKYLMTKLHTVLNMNIYTFLDSSNNVIDFKIATETSTDAVIEKSIKVPANATQLVISSNTYWSPSTEVYVDIKAEVDNNTKNIGNNTLNLTTFPNTGIIDSNGNFNRADGSWLYSDYIKIENCSKIKIRCAYNDVVYNIGFYNQNKEFISGLRTNQSNNLLEVNENEIPNNSYYAVFCSRNTITYYANLEYYNLFGKVFEIDEKVDSLEPRDFSSLKFACFGDSITSIEVTGTGNKINTELGTQLIENFAHGNATCSDWYRGDVTETIESPTVNHRDDDPNQTALYENQNVLSNQIRRCLAKATGEGLAVTYTHPIAGNYTLDTSIWQGTGGNNYKPDIIYIAISINDGLIDNLVLDDTETVFSQSYSELNKHGIASSLRWAIETLQSKFPDAQIFVCSPLQTGKTPTTDARLDYSHTKLKRDIIEKVCQFCSVHFIDSFSDSGFSNMLAHGIASNNNDLVHPTQKWSENLAKYIAQNIENRYTPRSH